MTVKITGFSDRRSERTGNVLCGDARSGWRKSDLSHG